jgi:hypothetical protein
MSATAIAQIAERIQVLRGKRVLLAADLARLYGVETKVFMQAVRRNRGRFPPDFCFILTKQEVADLRSQSVTSSWGGERHAPVAFTEHGALMAANVLRSHRALEISIFVVRAFVQMRETLQASNELSQRIDQLERKVGTHDRALSEIITTIRQLTQPPDSPRRRRIGFV